MKKYLVGIIFGFLLSISITVYADEIESVVGKMVEGEFPVFVGDVELSNKAIVVNGTSYLPVREFGESIGYEVLFDTEGKVILNKKIDDNTNDNNELTKKISQLNKQRNDLTKQIGDLGSKLRPYEDIGWYNEKWGTEKEPDDFYYETKKKREELIAERDAVEKEIAELRAQPAAQ